MNRLPELHEIPDVLLEHQSVHGYWEVERELIKWMYRIKMEAVESLMNQCREVLLDRKEP